MRKNIILVGFMGTGKSSVGRRLAGCLQMTFYDTDCEMEAVTGMDLMTLYWKCGKIRFQSEENLVLNKLLRKEHCVIATGGTLQLYEERLQAMRQSGMIVCLKAAPAMLNSVLYVKVIGHCCGENSCWRSFARCMRDKFVGNRWRIWL